MVYKKIILMSGLIISSNIQPMAPDTKDDALIAMQLQQQFDAEARASKKTSSFQTAQQSTSSKPAMFAHLLGLPQFPQNLEHLQKEEQKENAMENMRKSMMTKAGPPNIRFAHPTLSLTDQESTQGAVKTYTSFKPSQPIADYHASITTQPKKLNTCMPTSLDQMALYVNTLYENHHNKIELKNVVATMQTLSSARTHLDTFQTTAQPMPSTCLFKRDEMEKQLKFEQCKTQLCFLIKESFDLIPND